MAGEPDTRVWRYHPTEAPRIFAHEDDVPKGWYDHPAKAADAAKDEPIVEIEGGSIDLSDSIKDITAQLPALSDGDLTVLLGEEQNGANRKGLIKAIEAEAEARAE